ncbi:oxysterol-binding protein-related protein 5 isoform X1 [Clupea harengus]|uniref:Oxysterol-binding protein n=2 Tax=Clupea harengus TaxID=7950 RepID=A0A6P8FPX1_CLUHA|nr:oxysterol-binding protein-related protein 5 isoform X1 [Clupea harengus]
MTVKDPHVAGSYTVIQFQVRDRTGKTKAHTDLHHSPSWAPTGWIEWQTVSFMPCCTKSNPAEKMKEDNAFRRRFSLCPTVSSPQKVDPRGLSRNLSDGDHSIFPLSPGLLSSIPHAEERLKRTPETTATGGGRDAELIRHPLSQTALLGSETDKDGTQNLKNNVSPARSPSNKSESKVFNGHEKECSSPTEKLDRKESLKVQKKNYRQEKKRATKELFSALKDPTVVIMSNWLKIRGTLKSWTKMWCVLKPGVLLVYKSPKVDHWVGTILLNACKLIERPSKKDGFCFKLYHPLDQSIWAVKGPKRENVGSITQPLPSSYLIFRAASESDGRCWMDALELALSCSSLYKLTCKAGRDGELSSSSESSHILNLQTSPLSNQELQLLHDSMLVNIHMETDGCSDKSEREIHEESDNGANENGDRLSEESDMDQSDDLPPALKATCYVEQSQEEIAEAGEASQTEIVSDENKGLMWTLLKQLRPGMDLSKVVLPTFILEPRSFLDKLSDNYYHANFLSEAVKEDSAYGRIKKVLRWYLSGFYKKPKGLKKPYNPILGETFRCSWPHPDTDSCTFYIAEQVSHHPPISAFYVSNKKDGFCITGSIFAKSKFYGNSLSAVLDGSAKLLFLNRDEEYVITMPYAHCKGILYGTMTLELGGRVTIHCEKTKCIAHLEFKLKPFLGTSGQVNQISGKILQDEEVLGTVDGHWDGEVYLTDRRSGQRELLWNPTLEVRKQRLRRQVVQPGQQEQFESERLWKNVTCAIVDQDQNRATQEKFLLEETQRQDARERGQQPWNPRLFFLDPITNEWCYKHADSKPWDPVSSLMQFEKGGIIQTRERAHPQMRLNGLSYSQNWVAQQRAKTRGKHRKSNCSQNTESSSTSDPLHESSDNEGHATQCPLCARESVDFAEIEASIASIQKMQQDIQRNLCTMSQQMMLCSQSEEGVMLSGRNCLILCVLLLLQFFINYVST